MKMESNQRLSGGEANSWSKVRIKVESNQGLYGEEVNAQIPDQPPFLGFPFIATPISCPQLLDMAKGKLILICQCGGEFITNDDGTLSYENGDATAVNITTETHFDHFKLELAKICNLDQNTISIKYFLPDNRRILISLKTDRDLKRMLTYHANSKTADVFASGKLGFDHDAVAVPVKVQASRSSEGVRLADTVVHVVKPLNSYKTSTPAKPGGNAGSTAPPDVTTDSSSQSQSTADSPLSTEDVSANDTDYRPSVARKPDTAQSSVVFDMDTSPADTVKKRRRTASWKIGSGGPTIVTVADGEGKKRGRKKKCKSDPKDGSLEETGDVGSPSGDAFGEDDLPEKLVASWKDCITGVGQDFKSVKEFREALQKYAIAHRFVYKMKKNDTNRASGVCVEEGCPWSINGSWVPDCALFKIKKFNNSHTCSGESWKNAHPARTLLVGFIKDKLRDSPHLKPKEIGQSILEDFGIQLTYTQVWRGMEDAREQLHGSYKESYNRLPWFCEKSMETNPGSFVKMTTNDEKHLQFIFVSFRCCIQGFQNGCRPILFLHSTSLKSKYHESLLTATGVDADDGFFPVAFCIVDNESEDSWHWFLEQLKSAISTSRKLTFVSDQENGLEKPVAEVFENAYHGYSMYHLLESFKKNLKGPFQGEGRGVLPGKLLSAAHAIRPIGFKKFTEQIKQISPTAYDWVNQIEPEKWAVSSFEGERYNHILQNVAEPYAELIDEIRESTIMQKIEALIHMISELISTRQLESSKWTSILTPMNEKRLLEEAFKAKDLRVFISSNILFEVHNDSTHVVNIEKWECTCLEWKEMGLPCRHAIAAFNSSRKNVYDYCSRNFMVESYRLTYSETFNPIPSLGGLSTKEEGDISEAEVLPPVPRSPCQQKKEQTVKIEDSDKRTVICSKCKEPGHNKASCKANL